MYLSGGEELLAQFRKLDGTVGGALLQDAARAGAEIVQKEMIARAPQDEGVLKRNIDVRTVGRGRGAVTKRVYRAARTKALFSVGPNRKAAHGIPLELGHMLVKKLKDGSRKVVGHVSPKPYMRPAFHAKKDAAADKVRSILLAGIKRALG